MKRTIRRVLRWVRHQPALENADWLWNRGRGLYQGVLRVGSDGIVVRVGGVCDVRMPVEFASGSWEMYEPAAVAALTRWVAAHPEGTILDIGCSLGIMSACALAVSPRARVVAFDSDLASLKAAARMTSLIGENRVRFIYGFIDEVHRSQRTLAQADAFTRECLAASQETGDPGTTRFICLEDGFEGIASNSLDGLLGDDVGATGPALLKMDIEGAELLALRGGRRWLSATQPVLLLSVHPPALAKRGQSTSDVRTLLAECGYSVQVFAVDHEEHWWCEAATGDAQRPQTGSNQAVGVAHSGVAG